MSSIGRLCSLPRTWPGHPSPVHPHALRCAVLWEICTREVPVRGQIRDIR